SLPRLGVDPSPELIRTLESLLEASNLDIRARAAEVLLFLGDNKRADSCLSALLKDEDVYKRRVGIEAFGRIAGNYPEKLLPNAGLILDALKDSSPIIRRDAVR